MESLPYSYNVFYVLLLVPSSLVFIYFESIYPFFMVCVCVSMIVAFFFRFHPSKTRPLLWSLKSIPNAHKWHNTQWQKGNFSFLTSEWLASRRSTASPFQFKYIHMEIVPSWYYYIFFLWPLILWSNDVPKPSSDPFLPAVKTLLLLSLSIHLDKTFLADVMDEISPESKPPCTPHSRLHRFIPSSDTWLERFLPLIASNCVIKRNDSWCYRHH